MKIVLTGAGGFIGSCFLWKLNSMGIDDVYVVDTNPNPDKYAPLKNKKFKDYLSREELTSRVDKGHLKDIDAVVHLGACADTTEMDREFLTKNNLEYSQHLAKWALGRDKMFHYASSAAVYGDGKRGYDDDDATVTGYAALNPYGDSKLKFDQWLVERKLTQAVVGYRYFNVFGPNEYHKGEMRSMVCKAYEQIKEKGRMKLFASTREGYENGSEERDFVYVKDVADVMFYFIEHPDKHGVFNLGTGKARTFLDLGKAVFAAMGAKEKIQFIPMPDKLKGQYQYFTQATLSKLRQAGCNKEFSSLEDSVADYVKNHLAKPQSKYL